MLRLPEQPAVEMDCRARIVKPAMSMVTVSSWEMTLAVAALEPSNWALPALDSESPRVEDSKRRGFDSVRSPLLAAARCCRARQLQCFVEQICATDAMPLSTAANRNEHEHRAGAVARIHRNRPVVWQRLTDLRVAMSLRARLQAVVAAQGSGIRENSERRADE